MTYVKAWAQYLFPSYSFVCCLYIGMCIVVCVLSSVMIQKDAEEDRSVFHKSDKHPPPPSPNVLGAVC